MEFDDILQKKQQKLPLSKAEIAYFVHGSVMNKFSASQIIDMLKAIYDNKMTEQEILDLTVAMAKSGKTLNFGNRIVVDKHSSGGVSDTTTLIIVPIVAVLCEDKFDVVKISGGSLGHTGGTADKLRVLNGIQLEYDLQGIKALLKKNNACLITQSDIIAPADKLFYALRHKNGLVDSLPLIVSSILSKKIAMGANRLVLDIKSGNGALLTDAKKVNSMAKLMQKIMTNLNVSCIAAVTDMNQPLGDNIGCTLEFIEAMDVLNGKKGRLRDLSVFLATEMILLSAKGAVRKEVETKVKACLDNGSAFEKFVQIAISQNAGEKQIREYNKLLLAKFSAEINAEKNGFVHSIDTHVLGEIAASLGGGADKQAGIILKQHLGDKVKQGDKLMQILYNDKALFEKCENNLNNCFQIGKKPKMPRLIKKVYR